MAKRESSPGFSPAKKNEYGIEAGQILMQNIQDVCLGYGQRLGQAAGVLQGLQ